MAGRNLPPARVRAAPVPLTATVRFGVRPVFELADLTGVEVSKLVYSVDEKAIDEEIRYLAQVLREP